MGEIHLVVRVEEASRRLEERPEVSLPHPVPTLQLTNDQLGVGTHANDPRIEGGRRLEAGYQGPVLGHVVRCASDPLAHGCETAGWVVRAVEDDRADRSGPGVPTSPTVAVDDHGLYWLAHVSFVGLLAGLLVGLLERQSIPVHAGTRMAPQLSQ